MSFYWTNVGRETNIFAHIYTHRLTPITYSAQVLLYMTLFDVFVYFRSTNTVPVWMHVNWPWPNINSYHWYMHVPTMWILCHRYQPLSQRSIAGWGIIARPPSWFPRIHYFCIPLRWLGRFLCLDKFSGRYLFTRPRYGHFCHFPNIARPPSWFPRIP